MTPDQQREAMAVLAEVWALAPDVRLGQLLAHLGFLGEAHLGRGLGYIEDDEILAILYRHRAELRRGPRVCPTRHSNRSGAPLRCPGVPRTVTRPRSSGFIVRRREAGTTPTCRPGGRSMHRLGDQASFRNGRGSNVLSRNSDGFVIL